jgi:lysozyme family protein
MADLLLALAPLYADEGAWSDTPGDKGGETYRGISRVDWPQWEGWPALDAAKQEPNFPANLKENAELPPLVEAFYRTRFWRFDGVTDQQVANKLFNEAVNLGVWKLVQIAQTALKLAEGFAGAIDGVWGPATEAAVNAVDATKFLAKLRGLLCIRYHQILLLDPSQEKFSDSWFMRASE